ncbi:MAG: sodium:solute symporter family protein [Phycisphaerales bacterium]|nr:MAG: sodium:solute symporter family protein [Phycisphaerales bacterium]
MILAALNSGQIAVAVIAVYMLALVILGVGTGRLFRGTAADFFVASRGIGSFLLLMSLFGTTMTSFAIIGSSGQAFARGIGVYGQMVSWSGIFHSFCFFLVGIKLWSYGKRYGYVTQIQFFRDRFDSDKLGLLLFPALVGLVVPYLLMGVIGGATTMEKITAGAFPDLFPAHGQGPAAVAAGSVPFWLCGLIICVVVLIYVFLGGVRAAAWANALQTIIFIVLGIVTFLVISEKLGGVRQATANVIEYNPSFLKVAATEDDERTYQEKLAAFEAGTSPIKPRHPQEIPPLVFLTYLFIPFSVAMFPHLFQHWLTAKSARAFRLSVVLHPILMMLTWFPCVMIGVWATSAVVNGKAVIPPDFANQNAVLGIMVNKLAPPIMGGLLTAGVLAAIMSSLDSQFLCLGTIFTTDIVNHYVEHDRLSDRSIVLLGRTFTVAIVIVTYGLSLLYRGSSVFKLGIWCFTGFAALSPLVFAALYWRRATKMGAYACVITAAAVGLYFFSRADLAAGEESALVGGVMPVAWVMAASTAAMVAVSLVTRPPRPQTLNKFFAPR